MNEKIALKKYIKDNSGSIYPVTEDEKDGFCAGYRAASNDLAQLQQERDTYKQEVNKVNLKLIEVSLSRVNAIKLLKSVSLSIPNHNKTLQKSVTDYLNSITPLS